MFKAALIALVALVGTASAKLSFGFCPEPTLKSGFSVDSYLGTWHEIARDKGILFEYGDCVQARYAKNSDGSIQVHNIQFNGFAK